MSLVVPLIAAGDSNGGFDAGQVLLLAAGAVGVAVALRSTYRRLNRSIRQPVVPVREQCAALETERQARRDIESVMLELDQLARQIHGRIDTRFAKLETIIRDADERIGLLSRLVRSAEGGPALDITAGDADGPTNREQGSRPADDANGSIYGLADSGLSAARIADRVGRSTGEIELILSLRRAARTPVGAGSPKQPAKPWLNPDGT